MFTVVMRGSGACSYALGGATSGDVDDSSAATMGTADGAIISASVATLEVEECFFGESFGDGGGDGPGGAYVSKVTDFAEEDSCKGCCMLC